DIDLGTLPPGISKSELERIILRQVLIALRKLKSHEYEIKDETRHTLESYLTYIKTGRFQYDTAAFTLEEMERLIRKLSPQETQWLEPELKSSLRSENVRKRIIFQHSEDFISWLARRFIPRYQDLLTRLLPDTVTGYSDDFYR
ncbi:hypothetical protein GWO43_12180, partial [candidate division KSB1 bacterium]|nr:hypothetical protein [candidate division KSB1 bacterium]NIS24711.1 hypothetical protein [candidate division KSB1 bacterium]NIT71620.1 hypothetical protein [candidate division KSB1 bacterium]NIU24662.1 hypothetical protein [candidate division KSB1 bacterium]NIV94577.1 hypothetical protein [candidate division KSB1 bacterium]